MGNFELICEFSWGINLYRTEIDGISRAMEGFWVDEGFEFIGNSGGETKYWIPPAAIRIVEKVPK